MREVYDVLGLDLHNCCTSGIIWSVIVEHVDMAWSAYLRILICLTLFYVIILTVYSVYPDIPIEEYAYMLAPRDKVDIYTTFNASHKW